jgi:excisionase family DNA binding protein
MTELLKLTEVAQELGISEPTARRYVKTGRLPSVFVGGRYRVRREDIEAFLRAAEVRAGEPTPKPEAPRSSETERRRSRLKEIRQDYREAAEGLGSYCDAWEPCIDDLDREGARAFLKTAEALIPNAIGYMMSELVELAQIVGTTEDGGISAEMKAESVMYPAVTRYTRIGRRVQEFAASADADTNVVDFAAAATKLAKLRKAG